MKRLAIVLVAAASLLLATGAAAAQATDTDGDGIINAIDACPFKAGVELHDGCLEPYIVRSHIQKPPRKVKHQRSFQPEAQPSVGEVHEIIAYENARWDGPSISGRVACESGYRWNATNGQYRGLLQIGSIWGYLWEGTPRGITLKDTDKVRKPVYRIDVYDGGRKVRTKVRTRKVKVVQIKKGSLPKNADPYHGWAAIRVGQRAVSGYRTTSWECGL